MKSFGKQPDCPTSQEMLSYIEGSLSPLAGQRIQRHCGICDFCGAEGQLLALHAPYKSYYIAARPTTLITLLGVNVPVNLHARSPVSLQAIASRHAA